MQGELRGGYSVKDYITDETFVWILNGCSSRFIKFNFVLMIWISNSFGILVYCGSAAITCD
jgi:hypothetical protein